jgi:uncharacterized protein YggE
MKCLLLLLSSLLATTAFAGGLPTTPYIYVQGAAEERVNPDTLTLGFNLTATDKDQARAKAVVTEKSAAVFKLFGQYGIGDDAVIAEAISVTENYQYGPAGKREFEGYVVNRAFSVKLGDFALYPKLVNALIELRVDSLGNAQTSFSKSAEHATELKKAALAQARREADDIAASLGARITAVFAVSPIAFGEIPQAIFGGSGPRPMVRTFDLAMSAAKNSGDKYVFDQLTLSERLHVIFLIEPAGK